MKYVVDYLERVVQKDIPALPKSVRGRVQRAIGARLTSQPETFGRPLRRSLQGYRSLRVGEYRVLFRIEQNAVLVVAIGHRSVIYSDYDSRFL